METKEELFKPYRFEDLLEDMWVWYERRKQCIQLTKTELTDYKEDWVRECELKNVYPLAKANEDICVARVFAKDNIIHVVEMGTEKVRSYRDGECVYEECVKVICETLDSKETIQNYIRMGYKEIKLY